MFRTFMNMAFPLITYPYVTRVLGVENLGKYNFASSIIGYLTLISAFGISSYAIREGARLRNSREQENVFVNHKIYGKIQADMNIRCRRDIKEFIAGIKSGKSTLLKNVTSDYHYHTVTAEEERILDDVEVELAKRGYLVEQKKEELQ